MILINFITYIKQNIIHFLWKYTQWHVQKLSTLVSRKGSDLPSFTSNWPKLVMTKYYISQVCGSFLLWIHGSVRQMLYNNVYVKHWNIVPPKCRKSMLTSFKFLYQLNHNCTKIKNISLAYIKTTPPMVQILQKNL